MPFAARDGGFSFCIYFGKLGSLPVRWAAGAEPPAALSAQTKADKAPGKAALGDGATPPGERLPHPAELGLAFFPAIGYNNPAIKALGG